MPCEIHEVGVDHLIEGSKKLLLEVLDQEPTAVLVVYVKAGDICFRQSQLPDLIKVIGALEALKQEILADWRDCDY